MITIDVVDMTRYVMAVVIPLIMALIAARAEFKKVHIWFAIFLGYWILAAIGILHITSWWF